jgi:cytidyltransferase-like protein
MATVTQPQKVVLISGHCNVPHKGHIEYARQAKELAGENGLLYFIVNSDKQGILKKGFSFMPEDDRLAIMSSLKYVDKAFIAIDNDRTCCETIRWIYNNVEPKPTIWANGGDVTPDAPCPEEVVCKELGIDLVYGLGDKIQSSSWILDKSVKEAYEIMFKTAP